MPIVYWSGSFKGREGECFRGISPSYTISMKMWEAARVKIRPLNIFCQIRRAVCRASWENRFFITLHAGCTPDWCCARKQQQRTAVAEHSRARETFRQDAQSLQTCRAKITTSCFVREGRPATATARRASVISCITPLTLRTHLFVAQPGRQDATAPSRHQGTYQCTTRSRLSKLRT